MYGKEFEPKETFNYRLASDCSVCYISFRYLALVSAFFAGFRTDGFSIDFFGPRRMIGGWVKTLGFGGGCWSFLVFWTHPSEPKKLPAARGQAQFLGHSRAAARRLDQGISKEPGQNLPM